MEAMREFIKTLDIYSIREILKAAQQEITTAWPRTIDRSQTQSETVEGLNGLQSSNDASHVSTPRDLGFDIQMLSNHPPTASYGASMDIETPPFSALEDTQMQFVDGEQIQ
jgi:hypothetical protein